MKSNVRLTQLSGYQFAVQMEKPEWGITMDEPPPVGEGQGPDATRLLAAALGHCLSASLTFCLQKARVSISGLTADIQASVCRNERGRWRVAAMDVEVQVAGLEPAQRAAFERCRSLFEDFCIVTASIREGIPVKIDLRLLEGDESDAMGRGGP